MQQGCTLEVRLGTTLKCRNLMTCIERSIADYGTVQGFYTFFRESEGNPLDLMGMEDDQLLAIQNDLWERL